MWYNITINQNEVKNMAHILLCEDDIHLRNNICELLVRNSYEVTPTENLSACREAARKRVPDLAVLDVLLPDGSGLELCRTLRASYPSLPILILTCCNMEEDICEGFAAGADDYVEKPFRAKVLLSRIGALLRRGASPDKIDCGGLSLDLKKQVCMSNGVDLSLTQSEFRILSRLIISRGQTVSREDLVHSLWALDSPYVDENTLFVHMSRLRSKLGSKAAQIQTIRGEGYVFTEEKL